MFNGLFKCGRYLKSMLDLDPRTLREENDRNLIAKLMRSQEYNKERLASLYIGLR